MDGISNQVKFTFSNLQSSVDDPSQAWQLLLKVVADFVVTIENRQFYSEADFPVVEFASQAAKWLRSGGGDLLYTSMESEESPLLAFYQQGRGQFFAYSPYQLQPEKAPLDLAALRNSVELFIDELKFKVRSEFDLDISGVL